MKTLLRFVDWLVLVVGPAWSLHYVFGVAPLVAIVVGAGLWALSAFYFGWPEKPGESLLGLLIIGGVALCLQSHDVPHRGSSRLGILACQ